MGFLALVGLKTEERAEALVGRMVELALSPDDATALRGLQLLADRAFGRPVSRTEDLTPPTVPASVEELRGMPREQRLQLLASLGHHSEG